MADSKQTIEQKIAQKQDELARLKEKARKLENGQKIIIGGMMLSLAEKNPQTARDLLNKIEQNVTREADLKRMDDVITNLKKWTQQVPQSNQGTTHENI